MKSFKYMTKKELEDYGITVGIDLDRRKTNKNMIADLEAHIELHKPDDSSNTTGNNNTQKPTVSDYDTSDYTEDRKVTATISMLVVAVVVSAGIYALVA